MQIVRKYHVPLDTALQVVSNLKMYRPYGSVGIYARDAVIVVPSATLAATRYCRGRQVPQDLFRTDSCNELFNDYEIYIRGEFFRTPPCYISIERYSPKSVMKRFARILARADK